MKLIDFKNKDRIHVYDRSIHYQLKDKIVIIMNSNFCKISDNFNIIEDVFNPFRRLRNRLIQNIQFLKDQLNETISYKS